MLFKSTSEYLLSLLLFTLLFISSGFSQNASYLDSLDGKFALQFQISDNFTLRNFQGTILSGKYHFSSRDAIRLGVSMEFGDSEYNSEITRLDTTVSGELNDEGNNFSFIINSQYIRYITVTDNIALYSGGGPFIRFFNTTTERKIEENGTEIKRKTSRSGINTGLDLILGLEWCFYKYMSLSAEYGMKFYYSSSEGETKDDNVEATFDEKSFYITGDNINFGITVYF